MAAQNVATTIPVPSPRSYAQKVYNYSRQGVIDCYYSRLANFLSSPYQRFGNIVSEPAQPSQGDSAHVTLCDLGAKHDDPDRTRHFSSPEEFTRFLEGIATSAQVDDNGTISLSQHGHKKVRHPGVVVFLRGFASPKWLNHLGAALDVDPELFYRHQAVAAKDMPPALQLDDSYHAPFPRTNHLIQLRVCNTGSFTSNRHEISLPALREACEASMRSHVEDFVRLCRFTTGDSVVRRFTLHDLHNFSIEQRISIEVIYRTNTWSIFVWLDTGNDLSHSHHGPWLQKFPKTSNTKFHPVFQHRSRMALAPVPKSGLKINASLYPQSISHLPDNFGRHLKAEIMAQDAFYALNEIFEFSVASIDQLLEFCESSMKDTTQVSELLILRKFVADYRSYIKDTLSTVQDRGGRNWPKAREGTSYHEKVIHAATQLKNRYERLLERCERLQEHCASSVTILMNQQTQQQTDRAMEQTNQLKKLSILAYFYMPITLTASFFGMNFEELGTHLSIWIYFATSACLVIISIFAWVVDSRALWRFGWTVVRSLRERSWTKRKLPQETDTELDSSLTRNP